MHKILLVEDDRSLRSVLHKKLSDIGYDVTDAQNGTEALSVYRTWQPELILLDIVMPEKSGIEVLETIRYSYQSQTPVIVLSNLDHQIDIETGMNLGVNKYLIKSNVSLQKILQSVVELLPSTAKQ